MIETKKYMFGYAWLFYMTKIMSNQTFNQQNGLTFLLYLRLYK